jgi:uncharacterized protein (TIGR00288 family)
MTPKRPAETEHALAVFIDFENLAHGLLGRRDRFAIDKVFERLVEKGKIVVKKAYCDWSRFGQFTQQLHEAAVELIEIPKRFATGKNSADIRLVVDAIDLAYSKDHIDTFVILSGDSDFSPLVSKLKELGKHVIGLGLANATSELLRDNCDEFLYYEDVEGKKRAPALGAEVPEDKTKLYTLLIDSLLALRRENQSVLNATVIKETMKRKKPSFNEEYHGFATFGDLLLEARKLGLVELAKGKQSGSIYVTKFKGEVTKTKAADAPGDPKKRRRRGNKKRSNGPSPTSSIIPPQPPPRLGDSEVPLLPPRFADDEVPLGLPTYRPQQQPPAPKSAKIPRAAVPPAPPPAAPPPRREVKPPPRKFDDDGFGAGLV